MPKRGKSKKKAKKTSDSKDKNIEEDLKHKSKKAKKEII